MVVDELSLPPDAEAIRMVRQGRSFAEIRQALERYSGRAIADEVVSAYLSRVALTACTTHRYFDTVPWRVRPEHSSAEPVRMLRLLARRRESFPMSNEQNSALDAWLAMLTRDGLVVGYSPLHDAGFLYVHERYRQGPQPDIPIRARVLDFCDLEEIRTR